MTNKQVSMKAKKWWVLLILLAFITGNPATGHPASLEPEYQEGALLVLVERPSLMRNASSTVNAEEIASYVTSILSFHCDEAYVSEVFGAESANRENVVALVRSEALSANELIEKLGSAPQILGCAKNYASYPHTIAAKNPNDPLWGDLWGIRQISAHNLWSQGTGSEEVIVAVLDTGIVYDHEDLAGNMFNLGDTLGREYDGLCGFWFFYDSASGSRRSVAVGGGPTTGFSWENVSQLGDVDGHGTHVAGTIGAVGNNGVGVTGVNWNVKLLTMNVYSPVYTNGTVSGFPTAYDADVIRAIDMIVNLKNNGLNIRVANMSFGSWRDIVDSSRDPFGSSIKRLSDAGVIVVMSAGNDGQNIDAPSGSLAGKRSYPGSFKFDNTITVGAMQQMQGSTNYRAYFSNYSSSGAWVDLFAPGTNILSTVRRGAFVGNSNERYDSSGYKRLQGTSMSAPHVAGAAALLCSIFPEKDAGEIIGMLYKSAYAGICKTGTSKYGMLDPLNAFLRASTVPVKAVLAPVQGDAAEAVLADVVTPDEHEQVVGVLGHSNYEVMDNGITLNMDMVDEAIQGLTNGSEATRNVAMLPMFAGDVQKPGGALAAYAFDIEGSYLGDTFSNLRIATVDAGGNAHLMRRSSNAADYSDAAFMVMQNGRMAGTDEQISPAAIYTVVLFEADNAASDMDKNDNSMLTQAVIFSNRAVTTQPIARISTGEGGGGCNASPGMAVAGFFALCLVLRKRPK